MSAAPAPTVDDFIQRWSKASGSELANAQTFVIELCAALALAPPNPASGDELADDYVFERTVTFAHADGTVSSGRIDCYRRGAFVLESKKVRAPVKSKSYDDALLRAHGQAVQYVRALPGQEGRPPFILVVDVGNVIEVYAEFTRSGGAYVPFPDPRSYRIPLAALRDEHIRERLRAIWLDPLSLDPTRASAKVTREVSAQLAVVAKSLERAGHSSEAVAGFLTRCLFSMFAEDVELLPRGSFKGLLEAHRSNPDVLSRMLAALWRDMDVGGFCAAIAHDVLKFNGKLFKTPDTLPLSPENIDALLRAARADWREVEPAIFGTLLEQALDDTERHAFGAHYTPRAHVERLVLPTLITPLREDWANVQAAAVLLANEGKFTGPDGALALVRNFFQKLCTTTVLDPACGSGNFLYVALEHMKRLEGEVLIQLEALGDTQLRMDADRLTVDPHQLLGIEVNPRAAAIAEAVLWIGFLQWHFRTRSNVKPPEPVLRDFRNIECRDAVLTWDRMEYELDASGKPVTRWDGRTTKLHPVTGKPVPDEAAVIPRERYVNARAAAWPDADFIIGNPPFIGAGPMRLTLGDGYVEALRGAWPQVPESADFVMFWWEHAARAVRSGKARRFGLITTNSVRQTFNRRVVDAHLHPVAKAGEPAATALRLAFAIPDHPWVDSADGAAVRIAMTVGTVAADDRDATGSLQTVMAEQPGSDGEVAVTLSERRGEIHADLTVGANVASAQALQANADISSPGVKLHGAGFIVTETEAATLLPANDRSAPVIRDYRNGRDLTDAPRGVKVIDLIGLTADEARQRYPAIYQHVLERVKPEREQNARATYRNNWWIYGEPRRELRAALAGLPRYIATVETAKHRVFQFLDASILPDNMLVAIATDDAYPLGVLSSRVHIAWALAAGGTLEDRPRYNKSRCFETFPFPAGDTGLTPALHTRIARLAENIDAHRKRVLAAGNGLTLTGLYNVLDALREGRVLTAKEKAIHEAGLVTVLQSLHDELDAAVLAAYGWADLALPRDEATLLTGLVALNADRVREEAAGTVRYLRPAWQDPALRGTTGAGEIATGGQTALAIDTPQPDKPAVPRPRTLAKARKPAWPATLPERMKAVATLLAEAPEPLTVSQIAASYTGRSEAKSQVPEIVATLVALGRAREAGGGRFAAA